MVLKTTAMGETLLQNTQTIENSNAKIRAYKELQGEFESTQAERRELSTFALTEDEAGDFLTEIEAVGTELRVAITTNALKVEKQKDTPDTLQVQFALEGTEENVRRVLALFESLPYPSIVSGFGLSYEKEGLVKGTVDVSVILVKYDG
jgi:hypothetical protein